MRQNIDNSSEAQGSVKGGTFLSASNQCQIIIIAFVRMANDIMKMLVLYNEDTLCELQWLPVYVREPPLNWLAKSTNA